jgi:hypothetical protein
MTSSSMYHPVRRRGAKAKKSPGTNPLDMHSGHFIGSDPGIVHKRSPSLQIPDKFK